MPSNDSFRQMIHSRVKQVPVLMNGVCVCVCVCVRVYVVYEDTNLYNNMGMTEVLQFEGVL